MCAPQTTLLANPDVLFYFHNQFTLPSSSLSLSSSMASLSASTLMIKITGRLVENFLNDSLLHPVHFKKRQHIQCF
jgi:hypothetical protein